VFTKVIRTLALLLSLLVLITSFGALLNSHLYQAPAILTLCGLFLPVIIVLCLFLLIFWLAARSFWVLVPIATLFVNYPFIIAVFQVNSGTTEVVQETQQPIKLCTYNVQGISYGQTELTLRLLADFVRQEGIDILCMQEMDEKAKTITDSLMASIAGLRFSVTAPGSQPGFALTTHSRYPLLNAVDRRFEQTGNHALHVDVLFQGDTLRLYNIHLQTTHFNQRKQGLEVEDLVWNLGDKKGKANQLINSLQANTIMRNQQSSTLTTAIQRSPYPVIACGDFNAHPASYPYMLFHNVLEDGFRSSGKGYEYTYRYLGNLLRIDYCFHDKSLKGLSYRSHELDFSDHKAVVFTLSGARAD
jgi:endonuclease/exonuclease/phosphatase family metal-dependent hydrolase